MYIPGLLASIVTENRFSGIGITSVGSDIKSINNKTGEAESFGAVDTYHLQPQ